jgi:hypothetical protein
VRISIFWDALNVMKVEEFEVVSGAFCFVLFYFVLFCGRMENAERLEIRPAVFQTCQATRVSNACNLRVLFTHDQLECLCCQRLKMTRRKASTQCLVRSAVYYLFIRQKQRWAKSFFSIHIPYIRVLYRHGTSLKL